MLRTVVLSLALLFTITAHAENWAVVTDSGDGVRLIADVESVKVKEYKKGTKKSTGIFVNMQYVNTDLVFVSAIDVEECLLKQRGTLINAYPSGESNTYFWDISGDKMYDAQGQWLCGAVYGILKNNKKQAKPKVTM
jgi:hypothetical protein